MDAEKVNLAKFIISKLPNNGVIALGAGSTINIIIEELGKSDSVLKFISAASSTSLKLSKYNLIEVPLSHINIKSVDLLIDGADHIINNTTILKGLGGAPASEKILWSAVNNKIVVVDSSKLKQDKILKIPVEIVPMALPIVIKYLLNELYFF